MVLTQSVATMVTMTEVIMVETDTLLSPAEARRISGGLSASSIARLVSAGAYPKPIVLSRSRSGKPARIAWSEREVRAWVAARIRDAHRGPEATGHD